MQRRTFLKTAATVSAFSVLRPDTVFGSKANSAIRVGVIGCGNRGTAVISSMSANTNSNIIAIADLFNDKLATAEKNFNQLNAAKNFPALSKQNIYQGSKAYMKLLENKDVDAVLISSPAYSHVDFLEAAVAAGKHVYCEKPVATDVDGCRRVLLRGHSSSRFPCDPQASRPRKAVARGPRAPRRTPWARSRGSASRRERAQQA